MRIFYKDKIEDIIEIDSSRFHKIRSVLRMNIGDNVEIFDGKGNSYNSEIISISKKTLKLKLDIDEPIKILNTSPLIHLAFSIIKPSRFEIAVEKTTELGLHSILPIVTEYTNNTYVKMFTKSRLERIENISISAAEQCGTNYVPNIENPMKISNLLDSYNEFDTKKILFYENSNSDNLVIKNLNKFKKILVVVGPEGGFSKNEINIFKEHNFDIQSLGKNILRAETAAICAINNINLFINSTQ